MTVALATAPTLEAQIRLSAKRWTDRDSVALAVFAAEQVVTIWEAWMGDSEHGDTTAPRNAIDVAKEYLASGVKNSLRQWQTACRAADIAHRLDCGLCANGRKRNDSHVSAVRACVACADAAASAANVCGPIEDALRAVEAAVEADAEVESKIQAWLVSRNVSA